MRSMPADTLIVRFELLPYHLPLRREWRSARGTIRHRSGWLVRLIDARDRTGLGDCAPLPEAGTELPERAGQALRLLARALPGRTPPQALSALPAGPPAARAALEAALLDLQAQTAGLPLRRLLDAGAPDRVRINAALGPLAAVSHGFTVLKLKVGLAPVTEELAALAQIAAGLPPGATLRLDANGAWNEPAAAAFIAGCRALPVESLEEPLGHPDPGRLARLQGGAGFPLALDESLAGGTPPVPLPVRRLVLKPATLGGLRPALALAAQARATGCECVVTTTLESAVGAWAAAQLAAAVDPASRRAHGLATGAWFARDLAPAPSPAAGWLSLPSAPGLGVTIA
jgi:o-succinylbenzoate synthase